MTSTKHASCNFAYSIIFILSWTGICSEIITTKSKCFIASKAASLANLAGTKIIEELYSKLSALCIPLYTVPLIGEKALAMPCMKEVYENKI